MTFENLIVTPNRRLATFLKQQIAQTLPHDAIYTKTILSWQDWLDALWELHHEAIVPDNPKQRLSDWQAQLIWQNLTGHTGEINAQARQAYQLVAHWQCDVDDWAFHKHEVDTFLSWRSQYQSHCDEKGLLDPADIPGLVAKAWSSDAIKTPRELTLYHFDEFTPIQKHLLKILEQKGCRIDNQTNNEQIQPFEFIACTDSTEQLRRAANFAKQHLASTPKRPIGIVVPDIQTQWENLVDVFNETFPTEKPFNISSGQALGVHPIVQVGMFCLQQVELSHVIGSPFIQGGVSEQFERARFDERLSRYEKAGLPISFMLTQKSIPQGLKEVLTCVQQYTFEQNNLKRKPSEWIAVIFDLLKRWGYPGERTLDSEAYQAVKHFYSLISELASLDTVIDSIGLFDCLTLLRQRLHKTIFQGESQNKPIQVLGVLEAAGMNFSALWVTDMSNDKWPAKPSPNPFIPIQLQQAQDMPHASFARELQFARTMMQRFLTSADTIVMSYAKHADDSDMLNLPTPLIDLNESIDATPLAPTLAQAVFALNETQPAPDDKGLPIQSESVKGGASLFNAQSLCPFKAYATYRLQANRPTRAVYGLSARVKGTMIHAILEDMWRELKTHQALNALPEKDFQSMLQAKIHDALTSLQPALNQAAYEIEQQRLTILLSNWFAFERERGPFTIESLESCQTVNFQGLEVTLRIDRIDRLENKLCIIDYKTGQVSINEWEHERLGEPQLPLYACVSDERPAAIALASLRKDKLEIKGMGHIDVPGVTQLDAKDWQDQCTTWEKQLARLANEFKQGHSEVDPKQGYQTCQYCDLQPLCRIHDR